MGVTGHVSRDLRRDGRDQVEAMFHLRRSQAGMGADPDRPIFNDFNGSAAEIRLIISAVVQFCLAAQGEVPTIEH